MSAGTPPAIAAHGLETEVLKRPRFGRYWESRHNSDIAEVKRLTDAVEKVVVLVVICEPAQNDWTPIKSLKNDRYTITPDFTYAFRVPPT